MTAYQPKMALLLLFCIVATFHQVQSEHDETGTSTSTGSGTSQLQYDHYNPNDPLILFCKRYSPPGIKTAVFTGSQRLRSELTDYINGHVLKANQMFLSNFNTAMDTLIKETNTEMLRIARVMDMTHQDKSVGFRKMQARVTTFISCLRFQCTSKFNDIKDKINSTNVPQLRKSMREIYQTLYSIAAMTRSGLGDILGGKNCLDLLETMEHCCLAKHMETQNLQHIDHPAFDGSGKQINMCHDEATVKYLMIPEWLLKKGIYCPFISRTLFQGRYGTINCRKVGEGDHVVLTFHGFNASHSAFDEYSEVLGSNDFTVVSFDLYGHGLSAIPRYNVFGKRYSPDFFVDQADEVLQHLGLQDRKITVMGVSMGACLAVSYCKRHPDLVERMILISPVGCIPKSPCIVKVVKFFHCLIPFAPYCICRCCFSGANNGKKMDQVTNHLMWRFMVTPKAAAGILGLVKRIPMWNSKKLYRTVGEMGKPTLIVFGGMDKVTPPKAAPLFKEYFNNSHVIIFPRACHLVSYLMPTEIASICLAVLNIPADAKLANYRRWLPFNETGAYIQKRDRRMSTDAVPSDHTDVVSSMNSLVVAHSHSFFAKPESSLPEPHCNCGSMCSISKEGFHMDMKAPVVMVTIEGYESVLQNEPI